MTVPSIVRVLSLTIWYANQYTIEYMLLLVFARNTLNFTILDLENFIEKNKMMKTLRKANGDADSLKF